MNKLLVIFAAMFLASAAHAGGPSCPGTVVFDLQPANEAERVSCIESDGDGGGRLKVSSTTFNNVDINWPGQQCANAEGWVHDGAGGVACQAISGTGHVVAKSSGTVGAPKTNFTQRTTLAFGPGFTVTDEGAGPDSTLVNLSSTVTGNKVWQVIESTTASSDTDVDLSTVLEPGEQYRLMFRNVQNTSAGSVGVRFNDESGAGTYFIQVHGFRQGGGTPNQSFTDNKCAFDNFGEEVTGTQYTVFEFTTESGDDTAVIGRSHKSNENTASNFSSISASCHKDLSAALSSLSLHVSAGDWTGEVQLMKLAPITVAVQSGVPTINWATFVGTGTVVIQNSNGVSSVTDNGTGDYTVNFTTPFTSAYYPVNVTARVSAGNLYCRHEGTPDVSAARVICRDADTGALVDVDQISVVAIGD